MFNGLKGHIFPHLLAFMDFSQISTTYAEFFPPFSPFLPQLDSTTHFLPPLNLARRGDRPNSLPQQFPAH